MAQGRRILLALTVTGIVVLAALAWLLLLLSLRAPQSEVELVRLSPSSEEFETYCDDAIGEPRVEQYGEHIFVAIGYDLANAILVRSDEGGVLIDTGMSPARAAEMRSALEDASPGPITDIIYTHSHIDHVGGASAWLADQPTRPRIWASEALEEHFFKQYGMFNAAETQRGSRQFGEHVPLEALPCSALGRRIDLESSLETGFRLPDSTFTGQTSFERGGLTFELVEAHGETHDQIFIYVPELEAIFPGDNWYRTFPNLYTIRGTSPRPIDEWIASLDAMRRYDPALLIPSHTRPVEGREEVRTVLTEYRDAIQWVRDETVRAANALTPVDELAASIALPAELAQAPELRPFYGQLDWSARAVFTNELGWFDGRPEALYPLAPAARAERYVVAMGGTDAVLQSAEQAIDEDPRWSLELLAHLAQLEGEDSDAIDTLRAAALRSLAREVSNSNGRGYLLQSAWELENSPEPRPEPKLSDELLASIPLDLIFGVMQTRVIPERAGGEPRSVRFELREGDNVSVYTVTLRNRIAEVVEGDELAGQPAPAATLRADANTWRGLALGTIEPARALVRSEVAFEGSTAAFIRFMDAFERGF